MQDALNIGSVRKGELFSCFPPPTAGENTDKTLRLGHSPNVREGDLEILSVKLAPGRPDDIPHPIKNHGGAVGEGFQGLRGGDA